MGIHPGGAGRRQRDEIDRGYGLRALRLLAAGQDPEGVAALRTWWNSGVDGVYRGLGRTVSVLQPDGASTTKYAYSGNQTTVTDPAGNWKTFTKDVLGNLTTVQEPDPLNRPGGTLTTSYTYDWMNHVSGVTMTRAGTTQTRSFNYNDAGLLTSATNPENGTVNYYYNGDNTLWYKHDGKGQDTVYSYDGQKRVYMIQRYPQGKANSEDLCQRATYGYGTDPSIYNYGRLVSVQGSPGGYCAGYGTSPVPSYGESYTYNPAGGVASKSITSGMFNGEYSPLVTYGYDSYGRTTTVRYPIYNDLIFTTQNNSSNIPTTFTTSYDSMGRPSGMTDDRGFAWVQNGTYDYAGRPQSMQIVSTTETRAYNVSGQLSSIGWNTPGFGQMTGGMTGGLAYIYLPTQNNGQIQQMVDTVSGETIVYQYDALKRLTSASSSAIPGSSAANWTETFGYDGFGNLTGKTLNGILQSIPVVAQSNQLSSAVDDANGNMTSGAGATIATQVPAGTTFIDTDCAHNASCLFAAAASKAGNACTYLATYNDPHPNPMFQVAHGANLSSTRLCSETCDPSIR